MTIYTIEQKMSNTGSIHDLASDMFDRHIKFPAGHQYAVVDAAYYGGRGYTTHRTAEAAAAESFRRAEFSHCVIDSKGEGYTAQRDGFGGANLICG